MRLFWFTITKTDESLQEKFDNLSKAFKEVNDKNTNKWTEIQFLNDDKEQLEKKVKWLEEAVEWLTDPKSINFMDKNYSIEAMLEVLTASNVVQIKKVLNQLAFWLTSESIRSDTTQADIIYRSWWLDLISNMNLKLDAISKEIQIAKQERKDLWKK